MPKTVPTIELNVNSKPIRLSMYYSVCKNPDCDCNGINIALANESYEIAFFIDFGTGSYTESANKNKVYSKEDTDIINAFIVFINSSENKKYSLDFFKKYYKEIKERQKAKKAAIGSFNVGELMPYLDIFWSEKALSLAMNGKDYDIIDYYCVTPDCNCTEIELEFYESTLRLGLGAATFLLYTIMRKKGY